MKLKQRLIKRLESLDSNGIWSDEDCIDNGMQPMSLWLAWVYVQYLESQAADYPNKWSTHLDNLIGGH